MRKRGLGADFDRLWTAYAFSSAGSAVGSGALPLVAVLLLDVSAFEVSLLAALGGLASAMLLLPIGARIDARRKRPAMIVSDLVGFAALISVPVAAALGVLTYWQLCVVGVLHTTATIAFTAASGAHLKALLPPADRAEGNSRFESTRWLTLSLGPPAGGALIGWLGATATLVVDAVSFLLSAAWIRRVRRPEPAPEPTPEPVRGRRFTDLTAGWRYIFARPDLRALFWNAMLFGGAVMLTSPLLVVFMLRELALSPWQYGLSIGVPCLGAVLSARFAPAIIRRLTLRRTLIVFGALRAPWLLLLPLAPPGTGGLVVITIAETGLLFIVGVFNPSFTTYRMEATDDTVMARVATAWSMGSKVAQPLFMAAGGAIAAVTSTRVALAVAGVCCLASALLLPRRGGDVPQPEPVPADAGRMAA
ncbi:MFS transporter [Plantactinospora sp. GCM10030261]|uniref:MFS transporter n=1 Tax=Plantactinospora sp. GCM10030261 TaxID=3273420 RepID=UPI003605AB3A